MVAGEIYVTLKLIKIAKHTITQTLAHPRPGFKFK